MLKKKGIFLVYVLFTAVLLTVFLLTAVAEMHNGFFLTKRFTGEHRAYWAAESGIQYCEYKLKTNLGWPFLNNNDPTSEVFGDFTITSTKDGADGYYIHGQSNDEDNEEEFHIYFSKKNANTSSQDINIVPISFPSNELQYCSYNSFTEGDINNVYDTQYIYQEDEDEFLNKIITVGKNNYKATVSSPGIYIISDGRSRVYESIIEKMIVVDNNNRMGGGIYAGGNIDIGLIGKNSIFKISQTSNHKPEVYCKKSMNITKEHDATTDFDYCYPIYTKMNGTIYFGKQFNVADSFDERNSFSSENSNPASCRRKYGLSLKEYTSAKDDLFPKLEWNRIKEIKTQIDSKTDEDGNPVLNEIESGSYVAIYENLNNVTSGIFPKYEGYALCKLNNNYLDRYGKFDEEKFRSDLQKAIDSRSTYDQHIYNNNHRDIYETRTDENGNTYEVKVGEEITERGAALQELNRSDRGLIRRLICDLNGLEYKADSENEQADMYIYCSANPNEINKSDIFSIDTVTLSNAVAPGSGETNKTPIITLKKSVKTKPIENNEYFNLFTLTRQNNSSGEYDIDETKSTDLVFAEKNKGLSEKQLFYESISKYFQNLNNNITDEENEGSLIANQNVGMLYTNGYVSVNGKLSGTGQILAEGSVYFKAGTQLNSHYGPLTNSKLAIYSKGTVQMGTPEKVGNLTSLYAKIKEVLSEDKAYYTSTLVSNAMYKQVEITQEDKDRVTTNMNPPNNKMSLLQCMEKYYGFTYREAKDYLDDVVRINANYNWKNCKYEMPSATDIQLTAFQSPSSFSGIIYACGGFKTDANLGDLTINGVLVSYGANPTTNNGPGSGKGLESEDLLGIKTHGGIEVKNCRNFSIIYNSTDLNNFIKLCNATNPINLSCVYYNKL